MLLVNRCSGWLTVTVRKKKKFKILFFLKFQTTLAKTKWEFHFLAIIISFRSVELSKVFVFEAKDPPSPSPSTMLFHICKWLVSTQHCNAGRGGLLKKFHIFPLVFARVVWNFKKIKCSIFFLLLTVTVNQPLQRLTSTITNGYTVFLWQRQHIMLGY